MLEEVGLDAVAGPVQVTGGYEGSVLAAIPDVAQDPGEGAQGAPGLVEILQGTQAVLGG